MILIGLADLVSRSGMKHLNDAPHPHSVASDNEHISTEPVWSPVGEKKQDPRIRGHRQNVCSDTRLINNPETSTSEDTWKTLVLYCTYTHREVLKKRDLILDSTQLQTLSTRCQKKLHQQ
ncbi:hypothetical protein IRJ41_014576, partial [Triplophysa rosa]